MAYSKRTMHHLWLIFYMLAAVLGNMVAFVYCPKLRIVLSNTICKPGDNCFIIGILETARIQS